MHRVWSWFAVSLLAAALPAGAATVLEKRVEHTIAADGSVVEHTVLRVRLEHDGDLRRWSPYYVYLDEHRKLTDLQASITRPGGAVERVRGKRQDRIEAAGAGELHSSRAFHVVDFPWGPVGSVLHLDVQVKVAPYFPSGAIGLAERDPIERLTVAVRGAGEGWRWRLARQLPEVEAEEGAGSVTLRAAGLAGYDDLTDNGAEAPVLRYAWGPRQSWRDVGVWYEELLRDLPRRPEAVQAKARELTAGVADPRQRLEALLAFARRDVRYVAVEVGVGGYRPSPPGDVLARRWGDCKDKSLLLIDLLGAVGIEAWPALIRLSYDDDVDRDFPTPFEFNHLIVALPAAAVATEASDPVADGVLFVDPTQERGGASWLHPGVQEKGALVVRGERSALVATPARAAHERRALTVTATLAEDGSAAGEVDLVLTGSDATAVVAGLRSPRSAQAFHDYFAYLLPSAAVADPKWGYEESGVPTLRLSATVRLPGLVEGLGTERPSLQLSAAPAAPEPRELREAVEPFAVVPVVSEVRWQLTLPAGWCAAAAEDVAVANGVGLFEQAASAEGGRFTVVRRLEVQPTSVSGQGLADLKELSLAESRAGKRRLYLAPCPAAADVAAGGG